MNAQPIANIPGLTFRAFQGERDYEPMATVRARTGAWDQVDLLSARETIPTRDEIAAQFATMQAGSPDMLFAEINGVVVGYNRLLWWTEQDGTWVYLHLGWLVPEWRHKGIGTAMLRWAERRLREVAATHPTGGKAVLATNASSTEHDATALALAEGYRPVHVLIDMAVRASGQVPGATLPATLQVRPVQPEHYRDIYRAWKDAWSELFLTTAASEDDYHAFLVDNVRVPGYDPALWHVAWHEDEVAGMVLCRVRRGVGTVSEMAVRRVWRRRGIARALLAQGLCALHDRGIAEVRVITDADNGQGARSLYESVGFREVKQHVLYRKPMPDDHQ